ncbi:MAG: hypothetical protein J0H86_10000 [Xanthomonadaceae bacterium]|nr:hypothetical protein [Xanthomonadaceae bacterium]
MTDRPGGSRLAGTDTPVNQVMPMTSSASKLRYYAQRHPHRPWTKL